MKHLFLMLLAALPCVCFGEDDSKAEHNVETLFTSLPASLASKVYDAISDYVSGKADASQEDSKSERD